MALRDYLTGEVAEDWVDGLITLRDALRRLVLLGLVGCSAASSLLAACAAESGASPGAKALHRRRTARPPRPAGPGPEHPGAPASGSPSGGVTSGQAITFAGPSRDLHGFFARSTSRRGDARDPREPRPHRPHPSVAARLAGDGYSALAVDLLSEEGGTAALGARPTRHPRAGRASPERLVGDMRAGLDELAGGCRARSSGHRVLLRRRDGLDAARRR